MEARCNGPSRPTRANMAVRVASLRIELVVTTGFLRRVCK